MIVCKKQSINYVICLFNISVIICLSLIDISKCNSLPRIQMHIFISEGLEIPSSELYNDKGKKEAIKAV